MNERKYLTILNRIENLIKEIENSIDKILNINNND